MNLVVPKRSRFEVLKLKQVAGTAVLFGKVMVYVTVCIVSTFNVFPPFVPLLLGTPVQKKL